MHGSTLLAGLEQEEPDAALKMASHEGLEEFASMSVTSEEDRVDYHQEVTAASERRKWWKLYAMHFLFMWNIRTYEYVSIFLVALAFPKSLTATSIRGIVSTVSAMFFSAAVGSWIDRAPSRLPVLLLTISSNHGSMLAVYLCWLFWPVLVGDLDTISAKSPVSNPSKAILFGFILLLDTIQHLSAVANKLSVERDWIPVLVGPSTPNNAYTLSQVNSVMVRIDLVCKLIAPSLLPLVTSTIDSREEWIFLLGAMTAVLWFIEIFLARAVARDNSVLRLSKFLRSEDRPSVILQSPGERVNRDGRSWPRNILYICSRSPASRLQHYFSMQIWPASISIALLQLTVLAYSATLLTYLIGTGMSLSSMTVARASGAILALSSTVITPFVVKRLRERRTKPPYIASRREGMDIEGAIVRTVGMWGILSQFVALIPVVLILWKLSPASGSTLAKPNATFTASRSPHIFLSIILFGSLSISRIGHYTSSLMIQELEQVEIPALQRSTFAGTEQSFRALCELCHWAATVIWSRPEEFRWLALGSLMMTLLSLAIFSVWMKKPRANTRDEISSYVGVPMDDL